jgi:hypothetical protein
MKLKKSETRAQGGCRAIEKDQIFQLNYNFFSEVINSLAVSEITLQYITIFCATVKIHSKVVNDR